jgi:hypothetical protein
MSTPKEKIIPGTLVVVDNKGTGINSPIILTEKPGGYFFGYVKPLVGEVLEIISKPKKYEGINVVKVRYKGVECFVYYTCIRYSTSPMPES